MSGDDEPRGAAAPFAFTATEVNDLRGKRAKPVAAIRRLKQAVPTEKIGKVTTDRPTPPRVTRDELALMRRTKGRSTKVLARLTPSEVPVEVYEPDKLDRHPVPKQRPPLTATTKTKTKTKTKTETKTKPKTKKTTETKQKRASPKKR